MNTNDRAKASQKITLIGAGVDFLLAVAKIIIGFIGNSSALVADGIHSFSDLLSDGIVFYAAKHANEEADEEHPYGHERFETMATLGLAIILVIIGTGILVNAFDRLSSPAVLSHSTLLLSVAAVSIFSKEALYWYTLKVANHYQSKMLKANAWHHRTDALSSVIVFIGIIGSLNGYPYLDRVAAMIVGLMIIYIAWDLGLSATKELVDSSIDPTEVKKLRASLEKISGVNSVHSLRTRKSAHKISCDVHVQVDPFLSVSEGHIISVNVEHTAKQSVKNLTDVTVHIDTEDDETSVPFQELPERTKALELLKTALQDNHINPVERIQLHYLDGKIHVDFYLPLKDFSADPNPNGIKNRLADAISHLEIFGQTRVYFGDN